MAASAPTRGDKLTIAFGMISIPVQVFNGIDESATKIKRSRFSPAGNPIQQKNFDAETGEEVAFSEFSMKYIASDGSQVDLSDDEIASAMGVENGESELIGVYPISEFQIYSPSGPAQVRPQTQKVGSKTTRPFDKAYALFFGALKDADSFALIRYVTRGKPKLIAVFGDGSASFLHWSNEVREAAPEPVVEISEKERVLAGKLLKQMTSKKAPLPIDNEAVESVRAYAELKAKGEQPKAEKKEKVVTADDLMAMLEASISV